MTECMKCCKPKSREIQKLENAFNKLDVEHRGTIPLRQLRNAFIRADIDTELDVQQKHTLLIEADKNRDGYIDFSEFVQLMQQPATADGSMTERFLFRAADIVTPVHQKRHVYSYVKQYSCRPPPLFMIMISVVEVAVFLYYAIAAGLVPGWLHGCPGCTVNGKLGPLVFYPLYRKEIWRYFTYMFIHAGIEHLVCNVILQLILGLPLELVHKMWRVGPLYIAGVIVGSLLQSAADPNVALVGASGGCYALLASHLANLIMNWREMAWRWVRLLIITIFVGADAGFAIYRRHYLGECDKVSYMAHVGGALAGLLLGVVILKNINPLKWEKALWWVCLASFICLLLSCIVMNIVINPGSAALFTAKCPSRNATRTM